MSTSMIDRLMHAPKKLNTILSKYQQVTPRSVTNIYDGAFLRK